MIYRKTLQPRAIRSNTMALGISLAIKTAKSRQVGRSAWKLGSGCIFFGFLWYGVEAILWGLCGFLGASHKKSRVPVGLGGLAACALVCAVLLAVY